MRCGQTTEALALFVSGDLDAGAARAVEAHVSECASCAASLAETRAVTALARDAVIDLVPGDEFEDAVMARFAAPARVVPSRERPAARRVRPRRRIIAVGVLAAAAAAALLVVFPWRQTAGRVRHGALEGGSAELVPGHEYLASTGSLLELPNGLSAFVIEGARFTFEDDVIDLAGGGCVVAAASVPVGGEHAVRVGSRMVVRFTQADVAVDAGSGAASTDRTGSLLDLLCPPVHADEPREYGGAIISFSGSATVECAGETVVVPEGHAAFVTHASGKRDVEPPVAVAAFQVESRRRLRIFEQAGVTDALIEKYRETVASYRDDLVEKRERLAANAFGDDAARAWLELRIERVERMERVHAERLAQLTKDRTEFLKLTRRVESVLAAQDAYGRMLRLLGPAEAVHTSEEQTH
jgi:hypothetical protein